MIQTSNEAYGTSIVTSTLEGLLSEDPPMDLYSSVGEMWQEYIQSEADRRDRRFAPSSTTFCGNQQCARQVAYKAQNTPQDEPFRARARRTFLFGHMVEAQVKAQLLTAGFAFDHHCAVPLPEPWETPYGPVFVGPDGINLSVDTTPVLGYKADNVILEIKSAATKSYDRMCDVGVRSAAAGYYDQCQLAMLGYGSEIACMIVQNKNTAHIAEFWIFRDDIRIAELTNLVLETNKRSADEFERQYALEPHTKYHKGKPKSGDPVFDTRTNVNGRVHGWDELLGWRLKFWECSYCSWKKHCWGATHTLNMEVERGRPVWYAQERSSL
jgi:hypothetical protein